MTHLVTHLPLSEGTPGSELEIDEALVRSLLEEQHCDLASYPLRSIGSGWDNAMFRLGTEMSVRLPRRKAAASLIQHEQSWLPTLAARLTLPVPVPIRAGKPSAHYPYCWSVLPWMDGETADLAALDCEQAAVFGEFLRSLHNPALDTPDPDNAPHNPFRGVPLSVRSPQIEPILNQLAAATPFITPTIKQIWRDAVSAPVATEKRWLHGDLHPRNILVKDGVLSGIIDWGDMTAGDIATDLAAVWMLFPKADVRRAALSCYGASDSEIQRAKGWAITFATFLLHTGLVDNPRNAAIGAKILKHLQSEKV